MKPQLGDTVSNRYVLVSPLREETGMQVWKASDHVLSRDCQLFIVNSREALYAANATASMLAMSHNSHFTKVLQLQHVDEIAVIVTQLDSGMSLSEYLSSFVKRPLSYDAMRSIIGEVLEALRVLQKNNTTHYCISTDTVRITRTGVEIADAPVSVMLADTSHMTSGGFEQLAIHQIAALLYAMLTRQPSSTSTHFSLAALPQNTPMEFRVICKRGLNLQEEGGLPTIEMATIVELEALLDEHKPLTSLSGNDITLPSIDSECSIINAPVVQISEQDTIEIPDTLAATRSIPQIRFQAPEPHNDFSDGKDALAKGMSATGGAVKSLWASGRELLSEEGIDGVAGEEEDTAFSFPIKVSLPSNNDPVEESQLEKTGRIPVIGSDGRVIQPGEESARALQAEQEAIEAAYRAGEVATPPSFTPKSGERKISEVANAALLGGLKTKVVAIIVAVIIVAAALGLAIHGLTLKDSSIKSSDSDGPWPEMNLDEVPFGDDSSTDSTSSDTKSKSETGDTSSSDASDTADTTTTDTDDSSKTDDSANSTKKSEKKTERTVITADKNVKSVPNPKLPENTTAYEIDNRQFLTNPNGQQGFGYYVHLTQPQKAYRMVITIRSSGGQGYVRVNTSGDPTQGEQVAQFVFDESGTTDVKFDKAVETQDIMLWVPMDSLPNNQLYIDSIQIF